MKLSARTLLAIDRSLGWLYHITDLASRGRTITKENRGRTIIIKLMGLGSIIKLAALCDECKINKKELILVTFDRHTELARSFGFSNCFFIRTSGIFPFIRDAWALLVQARKLKPATVIDLERCSNAVGIFSTLIARRARCLKVSFDLRSADSRAHAHHAYSIRSLSHDGFLRKGLSYVAQVPTEHKTTRIQVNLRKVLVNINASDYLLARRYPISLFRETLTHLHRLHPGLEFHLTGVGAEWSYVETLASALSGYGLTIFNRSGEWDLSRLIEETMDCVVMITGDSGPLHLAAYLQIPTIAVWGPTQPAHFHYDKNPYLHHMTLELHCSPCFENPRSKPAVACGGRIDCMKIDPQKIAQRAAELIVGASPIREVNLPISNPQ